MWALACGDDDAGDGGDGDDGGGGDVVVVDDDADYDADDDAAGDTEYAADGVVADAADDSHACDDDGSEGQTCLCSVHAYGPACARQAPEPAWLRVCNGGECLLGRRRGCCRLLMCWAQQDWHAAANSCIVSSM